MDNALPTSEVTNYHITERFVSPHPTNQWRWSCSMVVVLTLKLGNPPRGSDSVFFAGEKFTCHLTFLNSIPSTYITKQPPDFGPKPPPPFVGKPSRRTSLQTTGPSPVPRSPLGALPSIVATTSDKSQGDLELEESFEEKLDDGPTKGGSASNFNLLSQSPRDQHPPTQESRDSVPDLPSNCRANSHYNGPAPPPKGTAMEGLSLTQLLRKSLSLSSLRSVVGSTLNVIGTSPEAMRPERLSSKEQSASGPGLCAGPEVSGKSSVAQIHVPRQHTAKTLNCVPAVEPENQIPQSNRISLHKVPGDPVPTPLSAHRKMASNFGSQDSLSGSASDLRLPPTRYFHDPGHTNRGSAPSAHAVKHETIAWGYAQMTGEFSADSTFLKSTPFNPLKSTVMYRPAGAVGGGGTLGVTAKRESTVDRSAESELKSMPVYGTPPSILFINMALAPGESKTYKYEIMLPKTLPPSHKGKIIRFSYKLIVGIQRGGTSHKSQVIQLPFRVFSFVQDDGSRPTYELMSPAVFTKDESTIAEETNFSSVHAGFPDEFVTGPTGKKKSRDDYSASLYDREELIDCVARTIARCQMSRKVSYDICKNADHVAQLILQKNVYRLGETVMGVLHFSNSTIPCFRMSAFLESQEVVEEEYAVRSAEESTSLVRRIYAEQHRYTLGTRRIGIELFIPPTSSPNFNTSAVSVRWSLRVEFITGKEKQLHLQAANNLAFVHKHAIPTAKVEAFDCVIPLQIYGCKDGKSSQTQSYEIL